MLSSPLHELSGFIIYGLPIYSYVFALSSFRHLLPCFSRVSFSYEGSRRKKTARQRVLWIYLAARPRVSPGQRTTRQSFRKRDSIARRSSLQPSSIIQPISKTLRGLPASTSERKVVESVEVSARELATNAARSSSTCQNTQTGRHCRP